MVVFLVLMTVAVVLLIDLVVLHRRRLARERLALEEKIRSLNGNAGETVDDLFIHPGHSWVRLDDGHLASVGATDFASNFAGEPALIEIPREGRRLRQGDPAWTFVSKRGRRLTQVMPVDATVLAVNDRLVENPGLVLSSPFGAGWIIQARVHRRRLADGLVNLMHGAAAKVWTRSGLGRVATRLSPALGTVAQDGGAWRHAFGDELDEQDWAELREELFPAGSSSGSGGE